jgi:tetratricopeptide (TPR) repeat protein
VDEPLSIKEHIVKPAAKAFARVRLVAASALAVVAMALSPAAVSRDAGNRATVNTLGSVHFDTSCDPSVAATFDRGVALLHSFWFSASIDAFNQVLKQDPSCVMADWGIAMSHWSNPFVSGRSPEVLAAGMAAVARAEATGFKTDRERDYVMAVKKLYDDAAHVSERTRTVAYEEAMARLAATYPDDIEARIFYALAIDQDVDPADKTFSQRLKAGAILEQEFARYPDHPGLAHYIIHNYDTPQLAARALIAARQYAQIAPAAAHALHMPSHTFTRLGLWQESIDTNVRSAAAASTDPNAAAEQLHAFDYMVYAYLQTGQVEAARAVVNRIAPLGARIPVNAPGNAAPPSAGYYAMAAIPAHFAIERNAWRDAASLKVRQTPYPWVDAVTYFARGLGSARSGNPTAAGRDVAQLGVLRDKLAAGNDAYWAGQLTIQQLQINAWIALDEGRANQALSLLRDAAEREDATEKSAVAPGSLKPARELLAEMLLELNRPREALDEFEKELAKEPNRFRAIYGAAHAATLIDDRAKADAYYAILAKNTERGDASARAEIQEARRVSAQ